MEQHERIAGLLERLGQVMRVEQREAAGQFGLQPVHLSALTYLARANRYSDTPAGVTEYLGVTKGTSSQTLLLLERKGLIERRRDERDRRVVRLALTTEGREVAQAAATPTARTAVESVDDPEALDVTLTGLLATAQRANGLRSFGVCHSCEFFAPARSEFQCGLTGEALSHADSELICREHQSRSAGDEATQAGE